MSLELAKAVAPFRSPERSHDARGFFVGGPAFITPSDVLARLIGFTHCACSAADPREERRALRIQRGREAARRAGRRVRPWEC